jgi:predicted  nucleic acid-binding Zn-ribbon protein
MVMSVLSLVKTFLVETFWPWFRAYAWPIIERHLLEIISLVISALVTKIKEKSQEKSSSQIADFEEKAISAEKKAMDSVDRQEIEDLKKEAEIWRVAVNRLKQDKEDLMKEIEVYSNEAKVAAKEALSKIDMEIDANDSGTILSIDGDKNNLPRIE